MESDHTKTSILIVNDHNVVAEGLKSLFHGVGGYEVVSIAKDGEGRKRARSAYWSIRSTVANQLY